jgi:hypothetical protein
MGRRVRPARLTVSSTAVSFITAPSSPKPPNLPTREPRQWDPNPTCVQRDGAVVEFGQEVERPVETVAQVVGQRRVDHVTEAHLAEVAVLPGGWAVVRRLVAALGWTALSVGKHNAQCRLRSRGCGDRRRLGPRPTRPRRVSSSAPLTVRTYPNTISFMKYNRTASAPYVATSACRGMWGSRGFVESAPAVWPAPKPGQPGAGVPYCAW